MASRSASPLLSKSSFLSRRLSSLTLTRTSHPPDNDDGDYWGPLGLNTLHEPSEPLIDFIFVHGLGGGSRKTWSNTHNIADYWPQEWLPTEPRMKNVRIHSFGYDANWKNRGASTLTIHDFGQALLMDIHNSPKLGQGDCSNPIVLVGHSMGGLVIKKVLVLARRDPTFHDIGDRIHTLFFLGTPHRGADLAAFLSNVLRISFGHGSKAYVEALVPNSEAIQVTNDDFRHVYEGVQLYSFFETTPTSLGLIVDKKSSILELPGEQISHLNGDHMHICKFESPADSNYNRLRDAFVSVISSIERLRLAPRIQKRQAQMDKLSLYLGIAENPRIDLQDLLERRTKGSCSWLTDKDSFHNWQEGLHGSPKAFWLRGEPASGKSTMAGHVVQYLEDCNMDCSFFFFQDRNITKSTISDLLLSLAWQMALSNGMVRQVVVDMCEAGVKLDKKDERSIWRTLFASRILLTDLHQPQYWVIDAIDECANFRMLFQTVLRTFELPFPLRIFLTSRPEIPIERQFFREGIRTITEAITLDASLSDIHLYLEEHARNLTANNEKERQELVRVILEKSNGNFLWTTLVVKKIEDAYSMQRIHEILRSLPKEMNDLCSHIYRNVMEDEEKCRIARAILRWTLCSMRPLLVRELNEALKLDIGESVPELQKSAGSICGHLVYVDTECRVQIAHETVREFFLMLKEGDLSRFAMDKELEHTRITEVCLIYLSSSKMTPPRFRRSSNSNPHKTTRSAFAPYAITHFSDHLARAKLPNDLQLVAVSDFFMSNALTWIEGIARSCKLYTVIHSAKNIKAYLERRAKRESPLSLAARNLLSWANDLIYVVAQFGKTLIAQPEAIFHLIPAVCPRNSIIFRSFKNHRRGLRVEGLSKADWDERLCSVIIPDAQILSVACQDNKFGLGTSKGLVSIYNETTFQEEMKLQHGEPVRRLRFSTTSKYVVSLGRRMLKYWNASTGHLQWSITVHDEIIAIDFDPDGTVLYSASKGNQVTSRDARTGSELATFKFCDWDEDEERPFHFIRPPIHADFNIGLGSLGAAYRSRPVSFWGLEAHDFDGQFHRSRLVYPEPFIHSFIFNPNPEINLAAETQATADTGATVLSASPDGTVLATGSGDGIIKLYDFEKMTLLHQFFLHQQDIRAMSFNSSGNRLFEIRGNFCNIWEPSFLVRRNHAEDDSISDDCDRALQPVGLSMAQTHQDEHAIAAMVAHHDGKVILCGRENGTVAAYWTESGLVAQELFSQSSNVAIDFLDWNQNESVLASADRSGRYTVRKLTPASRGLFLVGEPVVDQDPSCVLRQILLSPDGQRLLVSTAESDLLWDLNTRGIMEERTTTNAGSSWIWASDSASGRLYLFTDDLLREFSWASLKEVSQTGGTGLDLSGFSVSKPRVPHNLGNAWIPPACIDPAFAFNEIYSISAHYPFDDLPR
ncbi:hypothetical protein QQX98_004948 [Neonectria punicea]|uniref:GPI inositol-deacylase n=1 Tax=Neonectria punicea TaxID=979145 RepID=A0ABR1H706_9HYPO